MKMRKNQKKYKLFVLIYALCCPLLSIASPETNGLEPSLSAYAKSQMESQKIITAHQFSVSLQVLLEQGNGNPAIVEVKIENTGSDAMYVRNSIDILIMNAGTNFEIWYEYGIPLDKTFVELHSGQSVVLSVLASGSLLEEIMHEKPILIPLHCIQTVEGMQKEVCYDMLFVLPDGQLSVDGTIRE